MARKIEAYSGFVDKKYRPKDDICVAFRVQPTKGVSFQTAVEATAGESSVGTWTEVATTNERIKTELAPRVYQLDAKSRNAKIAYPLDLFENGNMAQLLSSVAGNDFGMKIVDGLRLEDLQFPKEYVKSFKGPKFGIAGVRKLMRVKKRPLCGTIIKPKLGLHASEHAKVAYESWLGGVDFVKDDENLTSQKFNRYEERLKRTLAARDRAERETGEKKCYFPNVTAESREMLRRAHLAKNHGSEYVMVDVLTTGFSAVQTLREMDFDVVIHAHRAMHAALDRVPTHGISMTALAKIFRLIGVDQLHIGTAVGKMQGPAAEIKAIHNAMHEPKSRADGKHSFFAQDWGAIKPTVSVCSGGLHPGHVPELVKLFGHDIVIQAGGGIHGHPEGTIAGAKAMRQSIDAVMGNHTLKAYAKNHKELAGVLRTWKA